jgi:Ca2+-binding RTX toxin-like protein
MYYVDSAGDVVSESASAGTDRVNAYIDYTVGANAEQLFLYGSATTGYGNALDNKLVGNSNADTLRGYAGNDSLYGYAGNDILNGGTGNDTMMGGAGDDMYYVDSAGDVVSEAASAGTDRVNSYINYTLGSNVEQLYLYGSATTGTGNSLNNKIVGNSNDDYLYGYDGNDTLDGGTGNDTMVGGAGNDTLNGGVGQDRFIFAESGSANLDTVTSFSHTDDTIVLRDILDCSANSAINGLSFTGTVLNAGSYFEGAGKTGSGAIDANGIYNNTTTGEIWYNPTSSTAGDSVVICTVGSSAAASLDNTDFVYSV